MSGSDSKIIIVTGPESAGKSTISKLIAEKYNGKYIEEYARTYINGINRDYNYNDILKIAQKQVENLKSAINLNNNQVIISDTYLIITKIWFKWYCGNYPTWIDEEIRRTKSALYLLCAPDITWVADDVRENGGENRIKLFNEYQSELEECQFNYRIVTGEDNQRINSAFEYVNDYFHDFGRRKIE